MNEHRPNPEALLARVKEEEARKRSGHLMLFFGAAAGVESHGRAETEALLVSRDLAITRDVDDLLDTALRQCRARPVPRGEWWTRTC